MTDNHPKKRLPCFTWVSTGECRYGKNCNFIHPSDLKYDGNYISNNTNINNKNMHSNDAFYYDNDNYSNGYTYFSNISRIHTKPRLDIFRELSNNEEYINPNNYIKMSNTSRLDVFKKLSNYEEDESLNYDMCSGISLYKNFEFFIKNENFNKIKTDKLVANKINTDKIT